MAAAAAQKRNVGGSLAAARRWRQRDIATLAAVWRQRCGGSSVSGSGDSAKHGGGTQHYDGSAVAAARFSSSPAWRIIPDLSLQ